MKKKIVYETEDGKEFDNPDDARQNEVKLDLEKQYWDENFICDTTDGELVDFADIANWMKCNPELVKKMVAFYIGEDESLEPKYEADEYHLSIFKVDNRIGSRTIDEVLSGDFRTVIIHAMEYVEAGHRVKIE